MNLVEIKPRDEVLKRYIDSYQYFEVTGPLLVKAVPTGTLECWIKLDGSFEVFDPKDARFKPSGPSGIYPMGNQVCAYFIPKEVKCLNIKLKASILGIANFRHLVSSYESFAVDQLVGATGLKKIHLMDFSNFDKLIGTMDAIVKEHNDFEAVDARIESVLMSITSYENTVPKISDLAFENHLTVKTLERLIKKTFGMTPKRLLSVLRFGNSIRHLNNTEGYRIIDALQFGYYDQSHFIRECRKLTHLNPKELLSKLSLNTNDLMLEELPD